MNGALARLIAKIDGGQLGEHILAAQHRNQRHLVGAAEAAGEILHSIGHLRRNRIVFPGILGLPAIPQNLAYPGQSARIWSLARRSLLPSGDVGFVFFILCAFSVR